MKNLVFLLQIRTPEIYMSESSWRQAIAQKEGCLGGWVSKSNYGFSYFIAPQCRSIEEMNRLNFELSKTGVNTSDYRYISIDPIEEFSLGIWSE